MGHVLAYTLVCSVGFVNIVKKIKCMFNDKKEVKESLQIGFTLIVYSIKSC